MKVWLLTNTPSPYQVEFLSAVHRAGACRLAVRFMRGVHGGRPWAPSPEQAFPCRILWGMGPRVWADAFRLHPRALGEALSGSYDLYVLSGQYTSLTFMACALLLTLRRRPWAMWLERPWPQDYRPAWSGKLSAESPGAARLRAALLGWLMRRAAKVFCIGSAAVEAYGHLGAPRDNLLTLPYCCDTDRFANVTQEQIENVRDRLGLRGGTVFLFSGALSERKGVDLLVTAFEDLARRHERVMLLLLGDGPLRAGLEANLSPSCRPRVRFAGHISHAELPAHVRAADVFVFPSRHDGWGVVVNEACAAGLPVITTRSVGAAMDLIRDGQNGFLLERDDRQGLAAKMSFFVEHPEAIVSYGAASRQIIAEYTLEKGAQRFLACAESAVSHQPSTINH